MAICVTYGTLCRLTKKEQLIGIIKASLCMLSHLFAVLEFSNYADPSVVLLSLLLLNIVEYLPHFYLNFILNMAR